jgi:hypothetical protein
VTPASAEPPPQDPAGEPQLPPLPEPPSPLSLSWRARLMRRLDIVHPAWLYAAALLPVVALAAWHWSGGPGLQSSDFAQYILHGRALAEGRPYRDIGYLWVAFNPSYGPHVREPGLPLLLAALFRLFGAGLLVPRLILLGLGLAFCVVAGVYFARLAGRPVGLGVTLFTGVSASVLYSLSQIQTDLPFALLVWIVILLYDHDGPLELARVAAITCAGALALLFRTAGVALIPAALCFALARRRQAGLRALLPPALWAAALAVAQVLAPSAASFGAMYVRMASRLVHHTSSFLTLHANRSLGYRMSLHYATLYPFPYDAANNVYHALAALLAALGLVALYRRMRGGFLAWFVGFYVVLLVVAPVASSRYTILLQPLITALFLQGLVVLAGRLRIEAARAGWMVLALATLLAAGAVPQSLERQPALSDLPDARALFDRIRADARATPRMRVMFAQAIVLTEQTGVSAMPQFFAPSDTIVAVIQRRCLTHVVVGSPSPASIANNALRLAVERNPALFTEEYRNGTFTLLRVTGTPCP